MTDYSSYGSFEVDEDDCCYAISEKSFVGVGELLCDAARSDEGQCKPHYEHRCKVIVAGESGLGKRYNERSVLGVWVSLLL